MKPSGYQQSFTAVFAVFLSCTDSNLRFRTELFVDLTGWWLCWISVYMMQGWCMGEEFNTGSLESKIEGRIRFGRELLGICLPAGQKDRLQSPTERENKARNYKLMSDKGYVRFWKQILLLQDMLWNETESEWEPLLSHLAHPQTSVPLPHTQHTLTPPDPGRPWTPKAPLPESGGWGVLPSASKARPESRAEQPTPACSCAYVCRHPTSEDSQRELGKALKETVIL